MGLWGTIKNLGKKAATYGFTALTLPFDPTGTTGKTLLTAPESYRNISGINAQKAYQDQMSDTKAQFEHDRLIAELETKERVKLMEDQRRKKRGNVSTLLTGPLGIIGQEPILGRKTLLG